MKLLTLNYEIAVIYSYLFVCVCVCLYCYFLCCESIQILELQTEIQQQSRLLILIDLSLATNHLCLVISLSSGTSCYLRQLCPRTKVFSNTKPKQIAIVMKKEQFSKTFDA